MFFLGNVNENTCVCRSIHKIKKMCFLNCLFRLLELLGLIRSDLDFIEPRMPEFVNVVEDADDFDPY